MKAIGKVSRLSAYGTVELEIPNEGDVTFIPKKGEIKDEFIGATIGKEYVIFIGEVNKNE